MRRSPGGLAASPWLRGVVFIACLLPFLRLLWLGAGDALGANPVEFVTRSTGTWALVFLCLSLTMTPLRRLTGSPGWLRWRRMLGLYCFFYATLHFALWSWTEHGFVVAAMGHDILRRPFIAAGFAAFALLVPLAATSTRGMMRRLGGNWGRLHRLVYAVAPLVIVHYWWHKAGKNDYFAVRIYAAVLAVLLGLRLWRVLRTWCDRRSRAQ